MTFDIFLAALSFPQLLLPLYDHQVCQSIPNAMPATHHTSISLTFNTSKVNYSKLTFWPSSKLVNLPFLSVFLPSLSSCLSITLNSRLDPCRRVGYLEFQIARSKFRILDRFHHGSPPETRSRAKLSLWPSVSFFQHRLCDGR
jgi:hypothetical protein